MTLRIYADFKKLKLGRISVDVSHSKIHMKDCLECTDEERGSNKRIDQFERVISIEGDLPPEIAGKIEEIANKCPVHRTLESSSRVHTVIRGGTDLQQR